MSIPTILRGYNDSSLTQKNNGLKHDNPHHRFIMEEPDTMNSIHAFSRFEEKGFVECFQQHHFRLADIPCDALYALAMSATQE